MKTCNKAMKSVEILLSRRNSGFTLVELMVTIAIATILMMVAVPSFVQFRQNAALSDSVSNFISAANAARANAMKSGLNTYMVPNIGTSWNSGWMVYSDGNWNKTFDPGPDTLLLGHDALESSVTVVVPGAAGGPNTLVDAYLLFNGSGYPRLKSGAFANGQIVMSNPARSSTIIFDQIGRVRSCKTLSTGC